MSGFAVLRLPYHDQCRLMIQRDGQPEELGSVSLLSGKHGFVMAPFVVNKKYPVLLLHPDIITDQQPESLLTMSSPDDPSCTLESLLERMMYDRPVGEDVYRATKNHYSIDFANFHAHIQTGEFSKIVLARSARENRVEGMSPLRLFVKACAMYPRMFVALISAERCGTWLMATPELLLEGDGHRWMTMSLAGTMTLTGDMLDFDNPPTKDHASISDDNSFGWTIKNIQEQRFVSTYITECLEHFANDMEEEGPYTMRAGNLVHLRSDFHFTLPSNDNIGDLIRILYPTPAVCGLPKEAARDFILRNEFAPRAYYSGFAGPLYPDADTHLYVSLRCMRIDGDGLNLYAGGGLLANSTMEAEWKETEDKMDTMRALTRN